MFKKVNKKAIVIATSIFVIATGVGIGTVMFAGPNAEADADAKPDRTVTAQTIESKASDDTKAVKSEDKQDSKDKAKSEEKVKKSESSSSAKSDSKTSGNSNDKSKGNTGNKSNDSNKGNTSKPSSTQSNQSSKPSQPSKPAEPAKPSQPSQPAHQHSWTQYLKEWRSIYETVTEQYVTHYVCMSDGMTVVDGDGAHGRAYHADTNGAFNYKPVYGTRQVQKFVGEEPVYGYKCSCGATK